eukprot:5991232-Pyramimonas_sp.AAC.1
MASRALAGPPLGSSKRRVSISWTSCFHVPGIQLGGNPSASGRACRLLLHGGLLVSRSLPWKLAHSIFMSLVQNSALRGLEAFLLAKKQRASLGAAAARYARAAMRGRASWKTEAGATR